MSALLAVCSMGIARDRSRELCGFRLDPVFPLLPAPRLNLIEIVISTRAPSTEPRLKSSLPATAGEAASHRG